MSVEKPLGKLPVNVLILSLFMLACAGCVVSESPKPISSQDQDVNSNITTNIVSNGIHRTFDVTVGSRISMLRSGPETFGVASISSNSVTLIGGPSPWTVETNDRYHVGNHEYLEVKSIDFDTKRATIDIFTRKLNPVLDALSF